MCNARERQHADVAPAPALPRSLHSFRIVAVAVFAAFSLRVCVCVCLSIGNFPQVSHTATRCQQMRKKSTRRRRLRCCDAAVSGRTPKPNHKNALI